MGEILYANEAASQLLDLRETEMVGLGLAGYLPEVILQTFGLYFSQAKRSLAPVRYDRVACVTTSARPRTLSGWFVPLVEDAEFAGMVWSATDVTARPPAAEYRGTVDDQRYSRPVGDLLPHYADLLAHIYDAIVATDDEFVIHTWNRSAERIYGWTAAEAVGRVFFELVPTEVLSPPHLPGAGSPVAVAEVVAMVGRPAGFQGELRQRARNGDVIWVETTTMPLRDDVGSTIGYVSVNRNLTKRKAAEAEASRATAELREVNASLRAVNEELRLVNLMQRGLLEASPAAIVSLDPDGLVRQWNPAAERIFGWTAEQVVGRPVPFHDVPEVAGEVAALQSLAMTGHVLNAVEVRRPRRDGGSVDLSLSTAALRDADGRLTGIITLYTDITERRRAEEERARLEAQVLHAQKVESLGLLAGGIAHDFNNLLAAVLGNADLALAEARDGRATPEHLEQIVVAARRGAELTRQMLAYSGQSSPVVELLSVSDLVREVEHLLEVPLPTGVLLVRRLALDLPQVAGDPVQLRQVVMGLVINAAEAMGDDPGTVTITTGLRHCTRGRLAAGVLDDGLPEGDYVFLEVGDTGSGMSAEMQALIFDPFFTTKFSGRGLGLAAVLGIARAHHGAVQVESEPGVGSTLRVLLPVSERPAAVDAPAEPLQARRSAGATVLVIDDEEVVRVLAGRMLRRLGYHVWTAAGGRQGVELYAANRETIDGVVLDLTMPDIDGEEVFARLRALDPDVRVLLSSGYSFSEAVERLTERGLAGFIQKPYRLEEFAVAVARALRSEG
jgi:PAS domain S-box-containing protein